MIVCAQRAQPAISVCASHMSSRNHKMCRQQTRLVQTQNASCAVASSKIYDPAAVCRVYFSHGRSAFTPVPKFVRERVLRYGRRSATNNVSLRANTVEHPLDWGDNAQRTADSASRPQTTRHRTCRLGHHDRHNHHSAAVRMVQHLRILESVWQYPRHQSCRGQRRRGHRQRPARQNEPRRPDRRHAERQRPAWLGIHGQGRSDGSGTVRRLLCSDHHPLRFQRGSRQRRDRQQEPADAGILCQRKIEPDLPENHRSRRDHRRPYRQQHLRLHRQRSTH